MPSVVIAEDHSIVRQGLLHVLNHYCADLHVMADVNNGKDAVDIVLSERPDILVVDLMMPGMDGLEVTRRVKNSVPRTKVIILSMYDDRSYVLRAFRYGASAYVLKLGDAEELMHAIREILAGRTYLSPDLKISKKEIDALILEGASGDLYDLLSQREREILRLVALGMTASDIAERLHLSPRTVEKHRFNITKKIEVKNLSELIRFAISRGIISENYQTPS